MEQRKLLVQLRNRKFDPQRLAYLLTHDNLTYQDVARSLSVLVDRDVMASTVRRHVLGISEPNLTYLAAYADYFSIPVDFFFEGLLNGDGAN